MTVAELSERLTQEELIAWAAYFTIKGEEEEKAMDRAKTARGVRTAGAR
jgi:hypothetical protein